MSRKKKKKTSISRSFHKIRYRRPRRVLSSRIVFGDIDASSEVDLDIEIERHGMTRGGRGRSV